MSKEARLVFENRLKQKIGERFAGFQEETILEMVAVLGHEKLDTTMKYVVMDKSDIKNAYQKYV